MPLHASTTHDAASDEGPPKNKPLSRAAVKAIQTARDFDRLADSANVDVHVVSLIRDRSLASTWRDVAKGLIPAPRKFGSATKWNVGEIRRALAGDAHPSDQRVGRTNPTKRDSDSSSDLTI